MGVDYRTSTGRGAETLLAGDKQNLACTKTQGKGAVTPQETEPDLPPKVGVTYGSEVQKRLALGTRVLAAAILEGGPWCKSPWRLPKIKRFIHE